MLSADDLTNTQEMNALKQLATAVDTRDHIAKTVMRLKYKQIYGEEPDPDLF